jgi:hypothetical protein
MGITAITTMVAVQGGVCKPYRYGPWDVYGGRQSGYR